MATLGALELLPQELQLEVLRHSALRFAQSNSRAAALVRTMDCMHGVSNALAPATCPHPDLATDLPIASRDLRTYGAIVSSLRRCFSHGRDCDCACNGQEHLCPRCHGRGIRHQGWIENVVIFWSEK
ncbi:uncharacterized protein PG986_010562 [Apiospora aurea]|uniref:Uncharacterized protein n=1 Tax=Apiospora aurea TaxID=335848 RepID=A0ABR1Q307_9PEZI